MERIIGASCKCESVVKADRLLDQVEVADLLRVSAKTLEYWRYKGKHGDKISLEGDITRGNENSNSLGFRYDAHILTCYPISRSIVKFKHTLFLKCNISGVIDRRDKFGNITEKRPKIIFANILPIQSDSTNDIV